ncbi:MAG: 30S ribosomal protein S6 [Gemmatimonadota bacterium]
MRDYEIVYIFDSELDEEKINGKLERYHGLLTGTDGGEVTAVDQWGRRQLAFPIRKQLSGYYVVTQFKTATEALPEFERILKLDDDLLRYLIVLHEGEPTAPMSIATRDPRREDDDDDDDDDEED